MKWNGMEQNGTGWGTEMEWNGPYHTYNFYTCIPFYHKYNFYNCIETQEKCFLFLLRNVTYSREDFIACFCIY
jgi:hypothetical protein